MADTSIEWTDATWNPIAGCTVVSPGCTNCYAMRMAARLDAMGMKKYRGLTRKSGGRAVWTGKVRLDRASLATPATWKRPKRIFVNSTMPAGGVYRRRLGRDAGNAAAHLSNPNKASGSHGGDHRITACA
jgi:protein gp37